MAEYEYINVTLENIETEHICCAFASSKNHQGMLDKKSWMKDRLREGMVFRKLNEKAKVFIEYIPAEFAWKPVIAPGYLFIHCLWVSGRYKGHGHSKDLMKYCLEDSKSYHGVCVTSGEKAFLTSSKFYKHFGFEVADTAPPHFDLMYIRHNPDAPLPKFPENTKKARINKKGLVIQYTDQCPFGRHYVMEMKETAQQEFGLDVYLERIETGEQARNSSSAYGTFGMFLDGEFLTYQPLSSKGFIKLMNKVLH